MRRKYVKRKFVNLVQYGKMETLIGPAARHRQQFATPAVLSGQPHASLLLQSGALKKYRRWICIGNSKREQMKKDLKGVGGWLAWLIFGLLILGPLATAGSIARDIDNAERTSPALLQLPNWGYFKSIYWSSWGAAAILSAYTGYILWKKHIPTSVGFAKKSLWVIGPIMILMQSYALVPVVLSIPLTAEYIGETAPSLIGAIVSAACWTLYLKKSVRVRNTYGLQPTESPVSRQSNKMKVTWLWDAGPMRHEGVRRLCTVILVLAMLVAGMCFFAAASSQDWGGTSLLLSVAGIGVYIAARGITWVISGFDKPASSIDA